MNIAISVPGRFHAFDLASQLQKKGYLSQLITPYPRFEVVKYAIPKQKVMSFIAKELIQRAWEGLPAWVRQRTNPQYYLRQWFDRFVEKNLKNADIFVGWSGGSLRSLRRAQSLGMVTVIERGSTHIQTQDELLRNEFSRLGIPATSLNIPDPRTIETELAEYDQADYICVPSLFAKNSFLKKGFPEKKILHNPYGTDLKLFRKEEKHDTVFRVIFAGGICIRKGVHYLLRAFSELNLPNAELWLIGVIDVGMKPFLKKYAGTFRLVGKAPQGELYKYYSQGSVFCILSIEEGLALVQAQAMACGLPVIATTNTGAADIIRDGIDGYIIPIRDVRACKEKLLYLYENQDICSKMGESARQRVSTGFTWDDYGTRMITAYERILRR